MAGENNRFQSFELAASDDSYSSSHSSYPSGRSTSYSSYSSPYTSSSSSYLSGFSSQASALLGDLYSSGVAVLGAAAAAGSSALQSAQSSPQLMAASQRPGSSANAAGLAQQRRPAPRPMSAAAVEIDIKAAGGKLSLYIIHASCFVCNLY